MVRIDYKKVQYLDPTSTMKEDVKFAVKQTQLQLDMDRLVTEKALKESQHKLSEAKSEYPLNLDKIITLTEEIEALTKGLSIIDGLKKEYGWA